MLAASNRAIPSTPNLPVSNANAVNSSAVNESSKTLTNASAMNACISSLSYPKFIACFMYADIPFNP